MIEKTGIHQVWHVSIAGQTPLMRQTDSHVWWCVFVVSDK